MGRPNFFASVTGAVARRKVELTREEFSSRSMAAQIEERDFLGFINEGCEATNALQQALPEFHVRRQSR